MLNFFRRKPKEPETWRVQVNGTVHDVSKRYIFAWEILALYPYAGERGQDEYVLNAKWPGGKRTRVSPHTVIDLQKTKIERFEPVRLQAQQG